ncbi:MAG: flavin reductase family protein [Oscillospiraceae bacterium]
MRKEIDVLEYAATILKATKTGILLTTQAGGQTNAMTIGWGTIGVEWEKLLFTAFVRENRFTNTLLGQNPEFTVNVPFGPFDKKILGVCGTKSGRDTDKLKELNVTLESAKVISVPAIKELPLTLECRVIYHQKQDERQITPQNKEKFYPQTVSSFFHGANKDYHIAYYAEIVAAYILQ